MANLEKLAKLDSLVTNNSFFQFARGNEFQHAITSTVDHTINGEEGFYAAYSMDRGKFVIKYAKSSGASVDTTHADHSMEYNWTLPVFFLHTHNIDEGDPWAYTPSTKDLVKQVSDSHWPLARVRKHDELTVHTNLIDAVIIVGRKPNIWIWQAPNNHTLARTVTDASKLWEAQIPTVPKYSDADVLYEMLRNADLNIVRAQSTKENLLSDFLGLLQGNDFKVGITK